MKRLALLIALLLLAGPLRAADMSLLNLGDFSGSPESVYGEHRATTNTSGINFVQDLANSAFDSIILGGIEYRAMVLWGADGKAILQISENRGGWKKFILNGGIGTPNITCTDLSDAHYGLVLGIDPNGFIHIAYNHHNDALNYRVSTLAINNASFAGAFGAETTMLGIDGENHVSYPRFFRDPNDEYLYFLYRDDNGSADADIRFYRYVHTGTPAWESAAGLTDGRLVNGNSSGDVPYSSNLVFTSDWDGAGTGKLCFSWVYRVDQLDSNSYHDIGVVFWDGTNWTKSDGTAQTLPITTLNDDVIDPIAVNNGLARPYMATDSQGRVHVTYSKTVDGSLNPPREIYHQVWNPSTGMWAKNLVDNTTANTPVIAVRDDGVAFLVGRDRDDNLLKKYTSGANDYSSWAVSTINATPITDLIYTPWYDKRAWHDDNEFICIVPYTVAPPGLLNGLYSYHKLEETGASSRIDAYNQKLLAHSNSPANAAAKIGNGVDLELSSTQSLSRSASTTDYDTFASVSAWVKLESEAADQAVVGKYNSGTSNRVWLLQYATAADRFNMRISHNGTNDTTAVSNNLGAISTATWYHLVGTYNAATGEITITGNAGTPDTATQATIALHTPSSTNMKVGVISTSTWPADMVIDELAIWDTKVLTTDEAAWLYNLGNARSFEDIRKLAPAIYSHGSTANVNVGAGGTAVATVEAYGDLVMGEALSGTDAASFQVTDNADGTWDVEFASPATAGTYDVTLTLDNAAGTDAVDFSVTVASGLPSTIGIFNSPIFGE